MFDPIDRFEDTYPKLYDKIIEKIRKMMQSGELKTGEKIPSERELAELFQVSRVPVREAIKTLEFIGVVQNIRGDGMYIRNVSIEDLLDKMDFALETSSDTINELFEAREALEVKAARLAALRRNEKDIQKLKSNIVNIEQAIAEGKDTLKLAGKFHSCIYEASKNKVLLSINEYLVSLLDMSRDKTLRRPGRAINSLQFHKKILDAIIAKDENSAASIMQEHIHDAWLEFEWNQ